jgi:hypothetical protein
MRALSSPPVLERSPVLDGTMFERIDMALLAGLTEPLEQSGGGHYLEYLVNTEG